MCDDRQACGLAVMFSFKPISTILEPLVSPRVLMTITQFPELREEIFLASLLTVDWGILIMRAYAIKNGLSGFRDVNRLVRVLYCLAGLSPEE